MSIDIAFKQLEELGFQPVKHSAHQMVSFSMTIPHGRFRNQQVEIALQVPQFPDIPPSGPHIKPFLLPLNNQSREHPLGGIHQRNTPTSEFQYWSRPFPGWDKTDKTMRTYLAFLRTLFDFE